MSRSNEGVVEVISASCWFVKGSFEGVDSDLLVDSGSTYTIVDIELFRTFPESVQSKLVNCNVSLRSASGELLRVFGEVSLGLELDGKVYEMCVKVVALGGKSGILGLDFMEQNDCILHLGRGYMRIGVHKVSLHRIGDARCARIQVIETSCIPPDHEMIIQGKFNSNHWVSHRQIGLVEPTQTITSKTGLLVAKCLVETKKSIVPLRIVNLTNKMVTLNQGSTVALLQPVESVSTFDKYHKEGVAMEVSECQFADDPVLPDHLKPLIESLSQKLSDQQRAKFKRLLVQFQDIFVGPDGQLGLTHLTKHCIDTGNHVPIKQRPRRLPIAQREIVQKELDKMEEQGLIESSDSPWASPLVIVTKKDGGVRVCVDYRAVNDISRKSAIGLPNTQECISALGGAKFFCTMDLASGYHQIPMSENDKCKTAFYTRKGLMQYTVMPFGLTTAPATFESLIEKVLRGLQWEQCVLYLDDVISFGPTFEETFDSVEQIFQRFRWAKLKLKVSKCKFFQESVEFLGHVVSDRGISCDPKKIEAVVDWPTPTCVKEVRSFLGFCSYYRSFVQGFSHQAAPLHELTKKTVKFEWSDAYDDAFNKLKARLVNSPILGYPRDEGLFILDTDASLYGSGAVLSQIQDGEEKVIAYGSKSLSKTQRNYCTTMRELLACVVFMKQFHHYLWGRRFLLRTDHASLKWLVNFREPEGMLARWLAVLSNYDFEVQHRTGTLHTNADGLSRIPPRKCKRDDCEECALKVSDCVCVVTRSQAKGQCGAQECVESEGDSHRDWVSC